MFQNALQYQQLYKFCLCNAGRFFLFPGAPQVYYIGFTATGKSIYAMV